MMLKTFIIIFYLLLLNGCAQSTSFLGPIIAGASSGSVHQAALSYGSNKAITQITGKTPAENFKILLTTSKEIESENATWRSGDASNASMKISKQHVHLLIGRQIIMAFHLRYLFRFYSKCG